MNPRLRALLATGGAVALTFTLGIQPALATAIDSTYTASPGGAITGMAGRVTLTDTKTLAYVTCTSSGASATLPGDRTPHAGSGFGTITALSFTGCTFGPGPTITVSPAITFSPALTVSPALTFTVTTNALPWSLNIASFNTVHELVHGSITNINITLSSDGCTEIVGGTAAGHSGSVNYSYSNEDGNLTIVKTNSKLAIYNATGCTSAFRNDDPMTIEGVYTVSPLQDIT